MELKNLFSEKSSETTTVAETPEMLKKRLRRSIDDLANGRPNRDKNRRRTFYVPSDINEPVSTF